MEEYFALVITAGSAFGALIGFFVGGRVQQKYTEQLLQKHTAILEKHSETLNKQLAIMTELQNIQTKMEERLDRHDRESSGEHTRIATLLDALIKQLG